MSSTHSALITGTPSRLDVVHADCTIRRGSDAVSVARSRTRTRAAFQRPFRLTGTPGRGIQVRLFVQGRARALNPAIQEQLFLIGREAVMNALRHPQATKIDVEVEYMRDLLHVLVRDNGCGIESEAVQKSGDSHWGLRGMCGGAENIGAHFDVRSRRGAGTEVRVAVPVDGAKSIQNWGPGDGRREV